MANDYYTPSGVPQMGRSNNQDIADEFAAIEVGFDNLSDLSAAELAILDGATLSTAELNVLDGYTGSVTELNYLDTLHATGVTNTEFDYLDGVTSNLQTQLATKTSITSGTFTPSSWGGFSADPSGAMRYQIIGDGTHKYVFITDDSGAGMTGTSNANTFTWEGIPAAAQPDVAITSMPFTAVNAGYSQMNAVAQITTTGTVTMAAMPLSSGTSGSPIGPWWQNTGWTTSGTKGFASGMVIMYPLVIMS